VAAADEAFVELKVKEASLTEPYQMAYLRMASAH
jgi:hypothetical protein